MNVPASYLVIGHLNSHGGIRIPAVRRYLLEYMHLRRENDILVLVVKLYLHYRPVLPERENIYLEHAAAIRKAIPAFTYNMLLRIGGLQ